MDLWVVAAAAGAGYAAKNLQNLSLDEEESLREPYVKCSVKVQQESRNFLQKLRDKTCPLRRLAGETAQDDSFLEVYNPLDFNYSGNLYLESVLASYSGDTGTLGKNGIPEVYNVGGNYNLEHKKGKFRNFTRENFIRSRMGGALNSSSIRLDIQIHREHEKMEDTVCSATVRQILVTDGSQIISRSSSGASFTTINGFSRDELRMEDGICFNTNDINWKSCSCDRDDSVEELQPKMEKFLQQSDSSASTYNRPSRSQGSDGLIIYIIGMTVGILSATFASKYEVRKLNKKLHHTDTLAQDLYEELEMKESLTVKELTDCGYLFRGEIGTSWSIEKSLSSASDLILHDCKKLDIQSDDSQLMKKIEAELEAELEVLEQNMKASALETYNGVEVDPDFELDIINGDVGSGIPNVESSSLSENGGTETAPNCPQPVNYVVCPWELSFRLHELIESRLEARIKELEIDLSNNTSCQRRYSSSETESPYTSQSPGDLFEHENIKNGNNPTNNIFNKYQDDRSQDIVTDMPPLMWDEHAWSSFMSNEDCRSEDNDGEDESEMLC